MTDTATIGHNSAGAGEILDENPGAIFDDPSLLEMLSDEISEEIEQFEYDLSTEKSRKRIASFAARIARQKTALDRKGKELNEERLAANKAVNKIRNAITSTMDDLKDQARDPLNVWEAEQESRKAQIQNFFSSLRDMKSLPAGIAADVIEERIKQVIAIEITEDIFGESQEEAITEKGAVISLLKDAHKNTVQAEKDRAELEERRKADAAREQAERQRRAEEQRKAEEAAAKEREDKLIAEAAERAKEEARAEEQRKAAERVAKAEAERDAAETARKAVIQKAAADKSLRDAEAAEHKAEEERRKADESHRASVMQAAAEGIVLNSPAHLEIAQQIVQAIVDGNVPHTEIKF